MEREGNFLLDDSTARKIELYQTVRPLISVSPYRVTLKSFPPALPSVRFSAKGNPTVSLFVEFLNV